MNGTVSSRPYYDHDTFNAGYSVIYKPGVGLVDPAGGKRLTASMFESGAGPGRGLGIKAGPSIKAANGSPSVSAATTTGGKNYAYDLEFQEYFDLNNLGELLKNLVWSFVRNYSKVLMSQPLEIVRLVLQVGQFGGSERSEHGGGEHSEHGERVAADVSDDSDSEYEINYFQTPGEASEWAAGSGEQSAAASLVASVPTRSPTRSAARRTAGRHKTTPRATKQITPSSTHTLDVLGSLMAAEGPMALFRGVNATFIYHTLSHTIEAWITGLVSPFLGIPDPFFLDLTHSPDPWRSLLLSIGACVATGLVLMPLDVIRVKLMVTHFGGSTTRSVRESLRNFPRVPPPASLVVLTTLHQLSASVFRRTAPYLLFIRYNMDVYNAPSLYTVVNLAASLLEFFFKLPVENVLRKEQVRWLLSSKPDPQGVMTITEDDLVMEPARDIVGSYGSEGVAVTVGQLYNGWRVGLLNLVGVWGYSFIRTHTNDPERL